MLQLVNLSNYITDVNLIKNSRVVLEGFLRSNGLDGLEMMFCDEWNSELHPQELICGVHLRFWPSWLDFWRVDYHELMRQFGSRENIAQFYGGTTREDWLELYRKDIRRAKQAGARYIVWHVCNNRQDEYFDWNFSSCDREVIEATIEVVNAVAAEIPPDMALLFENLWWPGLTLLNKDMVAMLVEKVDHPNVGIMLDTGHLMNTNQELKSQEEGVEYIMRVLADLGAYHNYVRGIHLHYSLSGEYVKSTKTEARRQYSFGEIMSHVMRIDQHLPFETEHAKSIIDWLEPEWLVHEFVQHSLDDWQEKIRKQQRAVGLRG